MIDGMPKLGRGGVPPVEAPARMICQRFAVFMNSAAGGGSAVCAMRVAPKGRDASPVRTIFIESR